MRAYVTPCVKRIQYLKHGQAFAIRNYIDELAPQVYLPLKYLDEFKAAPESQLSFPYFSELVCLSLLVEFAGAHTKVFVTLDFFLLT